MIQLIIDYLGITEYTYLAEITACALLIVFVCIVFNCLLGILNRLLH